VKQILIRSGAAVIEEVPAPAAGPRSVLVRVRASCVSVGTEMSAVRGSAQSLYRRALKQPEKITRVLQMVRDEGLQRTVDAVKGKLETGLPTGYSAAGEVIAVGDEVAGFVIGDRVACAGSTANHAEIIEVPVNLVTRVPDGVDWLAASTVTLGAIALQGVRRTVPTLGETIVVVGLGVLGQITVQLLRANGCRVVGVDLDPARLRVALQGGMTTGIDPAPENYVERVQRLTDGFGADAVIITAATSSDQVVSDAMQACRKKGRVVLVGDVGLRLNRADFYKKELDFLISTSYGPGRYDPVYEDAGQDYPLPYVRWTENRNMEEYLRLIEDGRISLSGLYDRTYTIDDATAAYEALKGGGAAPLLVLLEYPRRDGATARTTRLAIPPAKSGAIRVALVGAGSFAVSMHLPNLKALKDRFTLHAVVSRTGANARAIAAQYEAAYASTDFAEVIADADVDLVMIATRHHLHGAMTLEALRAGKAVFVEKPTTISEADLQAIARFYEEHPGGPLLMTGYNRRFSPAAQRAKAVLAARMTPLILNYRMNAGYVPPGAWVHGPEGGGRNLGEACHIYDLFSFFTDAVVRSVHAAAIRPDGTQWARNDNFVATVGLSDGSICTLTYTALGNAAHPKERMDIYADGKVLSLDDYRKLTIAGGAHDGWESRVTQKGQLQELEALGVCLQRGGEWPISLEQQLQTSAIAFSVERQLHVSA
jgi:predicted dehydrogenase/threonine dehydrogenase-like Zn-dependent dehydrogenase